MRVLLLSLLLLPEVLGFSAPSTAPELVLGEPVVVSQAPPELRGWGPWQFPHVEQLADGRIHIDYHIEADSAKAYGKPVGHAYSADEGKTWTLSKEEEGIGGLLLPNGDRLKPFAQESIPTERLKLPKPVQVVKGSYSVDYALHPVSTLPAELMGYRNLRRSKGSQAWKPELPRVLIPDEFAIVTEGVYAFPSFDKGMVHWRLAPDGALVAATYPIRRMPQARPAGMGEYKFGVVFLRSHDQGRTWTTLGQIPFQPDPKADAQWAKRDGFTEPDLCFLPDGSAFSLIRTIDGLGIGPLYSSRSADGGKTWSPPAVFDETGAWPVLLTLKDGVALASYGRPGLYIRASADSARTWSARSVVVAPLGVGQDTCSYTDLLALDDHTALLVYTDFNWPDAKGVKRKTVLARTVTTKR
jgi:hypothetical protein